MSLPPGLTLDPVAPAITGNPTTPGDFIFDLTVTDSLGATATQQFHITILPALAISISAFPPGVTGQPYQVVLTATGGTPPFTWSSS